MALVRKILEKTLTAGSTSISFTDSDIPNSLLRVYSSQASLFPISQTLSGNVLTVNYKAQSSNVGIALEIVKQGLDIVDNVTSTDTDKALSANQGKVLKDAIDTTSGNLSDLATVVNNLDIPDKITDLDDVSVSSIANGQVLAWNSTTEKFENVNQSGGGSDHEYSSTEKVIGSWIDGKPVYEICTTCSIPQTNVWSSAVLTTLNIKTLIDVTLYSNFDTTSVVIVKANDIQASSGGFRVQGTGRAVDGTKVIYTKTTD